jgi:cutinase
MKLPEPIKQRIAGVALYGYTKNKQNNSQIKGYPPENTKVFCPKADGVCNGALNVNAGHFAYLADGTIKEGYTFLANKVKAWKPAAGGGAAAPEAPAAEGGAPE